MRRRISAVGNSLSFLFKSASQYKRCDEFRVASSQLIMRIGKRLALFSRCDIASGSQNTEILIKKKIGFFVKGPHLLGVIANTNQRGGLLVTTTHCQIKPHWQ